MSEVALTLPCGAVAVPAYGVARLLVAALALLQAQTMAERERAVIDGGASAFLSDPRSRFAALDKIAARALICR